MSNSFRTIIIPASLVESARNIASCLSSGGDGMFSVALIEKFPSNLTSLQRAEMRALNHPITHYISTGFIDNQFVSLLSDGNLLYNTAVTTASARNKTLTATLQDCMDLVEFSDISEEAGLVALNRLNLQVL